MARGEIDLVSQRAYKYVSRDGRVIDINISIVFNNTVTNRYDRSSTIILALHYRVIQAFDTVSRR